MQTIYRSDFRQAVQCSELSFSQSKAIARISHSWYSVRFTRSKTHKGYTLLNLPPDQFEAIAARLFMLGCSLQACGQLYPTRHLWITFTCHQAIAVRFAMLFPCPRGAEPLVISAKGDRFLAGAAATKFLNTLPDIA